MLADRFVNRPADYDAVQKRYARAGKRVLALGYKTLDYAELYNVPNLARDDVEKDLVFAGFLVFSSPLKPDAAESLKLLRDSCHRVRYRCFFDAFLMHFLMVF